MDRKTLALLLTEALLIVVLVVVIAVDFNKPVETKIASHAPIADEHKAADAEAPAEEAVAAHEEEAAVEEAAEEAVEEEAVEETEAKHEEAAPAEKKAEKAKHGKEEKHAEKPAAKEEKAEAPAAAAPAAAPAGGSTEVADVVAMNTPAYDKHTKGIVEFTHKKHNDEYKIGCGECHHDDKGQPLAELKMGDPVQDCIACHNKTGKPEKGAKLSDAEKREYHMNALHDNCISCHKDYNKEKKTKAAPDACGKCHPKTK